MGAGQPNLVDALKKLAVSKAVENLKTENPEITKDEIPQIIGECVFVSEAFIPFALLCPRFRTSHTNLSSTLQLQQHRLSHIDESQIREKERKAENDWLENCFKLSPHIIHEDDKEHIKTAVRSITGIC